MDDKLTTKQAITVLRNLQDWLYYSSMNGGTSIQREAIDIAIKALEAEPHWIPVTENCDCDLMDNEEVLVFQKDGSLNGQIRHAMFYDFNGKKKFVTWEEGITIYHVVAYMPLPEPFKGVTE